MNADFNPSPRVPSISIYVRHSLNCTHIKKGELHKGCRCPKWLRWTLDGKQHRKSAGTKTWGIAEEQRRKIEAQFLVNDAATALRIVTAKAEAPATIARAVELFIMSKRSKGIKERGVKRYILELGRLESFMTKRSRFFPQDITLPDLTEFIAGWHQQYRSSITRAKAQDRIRQFMTYCFDSRMIDRVPRLPAIKMVEPPTLPLEDAEYEALLAAIPKTFIQRKAQRFRAVVLLMRWTGLAIIDAVTLKRDELIYDPSKGVHRVVTQRTKTGTHVSVPLKPEIAAEILAAMKLNAHPKYAFWNSGSGEENSVTSDWEKTFRKGFNAAGQPKNHSHQLRDTFAVGMILEGVPSAEIAAMIGDDLKTFEKHYAPWIPRRQNRLDDLVMATWKTKETPAPVPAFTGFSV